MRSFLTVLLTISVLLLVSISCKTSSDTIRKVGMDDTESREKPGYASKVDSAFLSHHRSQLRNVYASQRHDYPELFQKSISSNEQNNKVDYRGYRIQLISTRNVSLADSAQVRFQKWLDTYPTSYTPNSYKFFHQPYYRVHIGDFQDRERAIKYSRLLKKHFPGAWVVHDRIKPRRVPSDSVDIAFTTDTLVSKTDTAITVPDSLQFDPAESPTH